MNTRDPLTRLSPRVPSELSPVPSVIDGESADGDTRKFGRVHDSLRGFPVFSEIKRVSAKFSGGQEARGGGVGDAETEGVQSFLHARTA